MPTPSQTPQRKQSVAKPEETPGKETDLGPNRPSSLILGLTVHLSLGLADSLSLGLIAQPIACPNLNPGPAPGCLQVTKV